MTHGEIAALSVAALLAGAMNAVAGGGTVLTFPALLLYGVSAIHANATSTLALIDRNDRERLRLPPPDEGGRPPAILLWSGERHWQEYWARCFSLAPASRLFSSLVPFLLLFATFRCFWQITHCAVWFALNRSPGLPICSTGAGSWPPMRSSFWSRSMAVTSARGIGILMLASLGILGMHNIHEMNALKTILAALINLVATIYFIFAGLIVWPEAMVMTLGATVGYRWLSTTPSASLRAARKGSSPPRPSAWAFPRGCSGNSSLRRKFNYG